MKPIYTMYSVFGIVLTGEAAAELIAERFMWIVLFASCVGLYYLLKGLIHDFKNAYYDPTDKKPRKENPSA